ncbi:MAG: M23 family peptidase, partial [Novosphingobium sp.]|nr:M23 family peptidase [Novosphingobium sp.]
MKPPVGDQGVLATADQQGGLEPAPEHRSDAPRARLGLAALKACLPRPDIALDLAEDIGSARWFRGMGAMLGLSLAALSVWPDFSAVEAAAAIPADRATRDEFRSQ